MDSTLPVDNMFARAMLAALAALRPVAQIKIAQLVQRAAPITGSV